MRRTVYGLRTEGAGPLREAAAIGVGVFVGCSPFYGFHLLICWGLGTLFGLNRLKVYLAAQVSNPMVAPFLLLAEIQVGAWVRSGANHAFSVQTLKTVDPWIFGRDLMVGFAVVGGLLSVMAAALTYFIVRTQTGEAAFVTLVRRASDRYVGGSLVAWEFARAKLHRDPIYETVVRGGLLPSGGTLLDIGCGHGLMLAVLVEATEPVPGLTPSASPSPPRFDRLVGVELRAKVARLAQLALDGSAEILQADASGVPLPGCSAALLFDVLQMIPADAQVELLQRIRTMLAPGGVILVREADASAGWRFAIVRTVNWLQALRVGAWRQTFQYRDRQDWLDLFDSCRLDAEVSLQRGGGTLGNVLFRITARPA